MSSEPPVGRSASRGGPGCTPGARRSSPTLRRRLRWFDHLARAGGRYERVHSDLLAAGVTYFAFLGLFPVLLLAASIFGLFLAGDALLQQQLFDAIRETFPGELGEQLVHEVSSAVGSAGVTGLIGLVGFLYAGLRTVDKLRIGMELIWKGAVEKSDFLRDNLQDLLALRRPRRDRGGQPGAHRRGHPGDVPGDEAARPGRRARLRRPHLDRSASPWPSLVDVVIFLWLLRVVPSVSLPAAPPAARGAVRRGRVRGR